MITLGEAKSFLAPFVDGGVCDDDSRVINSINEATEILLAKSEWKDTTKIIRMCVCDNCITLPREIDKILKFRMDGNKGYVFSKWYEFMDNGPGLVEFNCSGYADLVDRGMSPTQFDIIEPLPLLLLQDTDEDNAEILIRGLDETGREIRGPKGESDASGPGSC